MVIIQRLRGALAAVLRALGRAFAYLPALACAWLCLRVAELAHAGAAGLPLGVLVGPALATDFMTLLRYGAVLLLAAMPLMLIRAARGRMVAVGILWSLLLCLQAALVQYAWIAGVPLGADLFGYTLREAQTTVAAGWTASGMLATALAASLFVLWSMLLWRTRSPRQPAGPKRTLVAMAVCVLAWLALPTHVQPDAVDGEAGRNAIVNKAGFLADAAIGELLGSRASVQAAGRWLGKDPAYPFAHAERTPDTLGPFFKVTPGTRPNLVFVIVEGLGRTFSGPGARLGSFTPFLDELAGHSLYWENFLAGQGRTFGVLPTIFGSLPFGANGFAALGERMPRHDSLLSVLKSQGYHLRYYAGTDPEFDNEAAYLRREGVDRLVTERDFGPAYHRANEWGYADGDLVDVALRGESGDAAAPFVSIIQTASMHSPFTFPGREAYMARVGQRMAQLGIAPGKGQYESQREIFASVLYTDDALRRFFAQARDLPGYANTIFIITGDHRLPELPMDTRIERYHVPLIVYSPMLTAPRSIKAVSSQFDLAPSLLAFLSHEYGLASPSQVTWLGTGLDTGATFRNLHVVPLKQTKTELSDFVSGTAYLAQDQFYTLGDGMRIDRSDDAAALAVAQAQFRAFQGANASVGRGLSARASGTAPYSAPARTLRSVPLAADGGEVLVAALRRRADGMVEASFTNEGEGQSQRFAPLLVVSDANGRELGETTGQPLVLKGGESARVVLRQPAGGLAHGTYYFSMLPAHPDTGRPVGIGQYHVEVGL